MALPKIDKPIFELKLPSTGEIVNYTPFSVREEKILLIARESKDIDQSILSVKQVVNNCLIDKSIDSIAIFDLEYILLMMRSKSVDNTVKFSITDPETKESVQLELDLEEVKVSRNAEHTNLIKVNNEYTLYMRYPTINEFLTLVKGKDDNNVTLEIMTKCMDKLVSAEEVYKFADFDETEINEFIDDLNSDVITKLKQFFETMPKLRHELKYKNKNGADKTFVIEGLETFFI